MLRRLLFLLPLLLACGEAKVVHSVQRWPMDVERLDRERHGQCDPNAEPESWHFCGKVDWCCYRIRCKGGDGKGLFDVPICPKLYGEEESREGAWRYWERKVIEQLRFLQQRYGECGIQEASCSWEPQGNGICWKYPNG